MLLLIDDDLDFLVSTAKRLELRGYSVKTASTRQALAPILPPPSNELVLIFVDYGMDDGGTPLWRDLASTPVPTYVMTGLGTGFPGHAEVLTAGIRGILRKPLVIEEVLRILALHGEKPNLPRES